MFKLSAADYTNLWDCHNLQIQDLEPDDDLDLIFICPKLLGTGYERSIRLRGVDLLIIDKTYDDDLTITGLEAEDRCIEFGFNLAGTVANRTSGHNFLQWGFSDLSSCEKLGKERILKVDIHVDSVDLLRSFGSGRFNQLPPAVETLIATGSPASYDDLGIITPMMKLALEQIINCPYQGLTKHIYLEAKCFELIALKLEQSAENLTGTKLVISLKPEDIDRIYHARDILTCNLDRPPSLLALARQVGLNDCTLKKGFRQVFGTTAFGYLHQRRMERARILLLERQLSVNQVAQTVGYASRSAFITAFRKRFGVSPRKIVDRDSV